MKKYVAATDLAQPLLTVLLARVRELRNEGHVLVVLRRRMEHLDRSALGLLFSAYFCEKKKNPRLPLREVHQYQDCFLFAIRADATLPMLAPQGLP